MDKIKKCSVNPCSAGKSVYTFANSLDPVQRSFLFVIYMNMKGISPK